MLLRTLLYTSLIVEAEFSSNMTWEDTWNDILDGGNPRWKIDDVDAKDEALGQITKHASLTSDSLKILCPLAGDDIFVYNAWSKGHDATAIDLVPAAVAAMRKQFGSSDWTKQERANGMVEWKLAHGRATLYQGDVLSVLPQLQGSFDAIYDKDSFGALPLQIRSDYCKRLACYAKPGAILYVEVKLKDKEHPGREEGPPFSVDKDILMEKSNFGECFDYVAGLGEVYDLSMPLVSQTAHILRRNLTKVKK